MTYAIVTGSFDNLSALQMRFLEGAARLGRLRVLLWDDALTEARTGCPPRFTLAERRYLLEAIRYVDNVQIASEPLPGAGTQTGDLWAVTSDDDTPAARAPAGAVGLKYQVLLSDGLAGFPPAAASILFNPGHRRVIVTGCYDWLHSGHIRFFEEASQYGDLYVVVGHDANVRLLKGEGHPLFGQEQRRYMVGSVRYVTQALIATGMGWLDAEPEITRIQPHAYIVNEDGDKPEKRAFCTARGVEYVILERTPKEGLPRRASTDLRGF
jgi:cytidyltransferase-like protein